jgi:glycosyltransferase involved in cell wall biosynthesis
MHSLHKGLLAEGVDVQVLADISEVGFPYQIYEGLPIWGIKFPSLTHHLMHPMNILLWFDRVKILKFVKENIPNIDLIQVTPFREPAFWGFWLSKNLNIPWVGRIACSGSYGDFHYISKYMSRNWMVRRLIPKLLKSCSAAIALDQETYREALENGLRADRVVIIPNAISLNELPCAESAARIPEDGSLLLLGRAAIQKHLGDVFKAYAICKHAKFENKTEYMPILNVVGGGDVRELKRLADQLGIQESVRFYGQLDDISAFLKGALCIINASESEGLPNAVLEASSYGVPAILSNIPIHREIARQTGMEEYLFPVGDERALCEGILRYLSLEGKEVAQKRIECCRFAQDFRKERRDEAYRTLYDRIVKAYDVENREPKEGN